MKKIAYLTFIIGAFLFLSGCGHQQNNQTGENTQTEQTQMDQTNQQ